MSYGGRFQLIGPDDNVLFEVASHQVLVTALAFFPQLASLVVGYNFGAFQIINLSTLTIRYVVGVWTSFVSAIYRFFPAL